MSDVIFENDYEYGVKVVQDNIFDSSLRRGLVIIKKAGEIRKLPYVELLLKRSEKEAKDKNIMVCAVIIKALSLCEGKEINRKILEIDNLNYLIEKSDKVKGIISKIK